MHVLERKQILPISNQKAWEFVSAPENLKLITPPEMKFEIRSKPQGKMYAGMMITYTVSPFPGVPLTWVSEITHVREPDFFVDEQRIGPYSLWHHQHILKEVKGGVEMTDIVTYKVPGGILGRLLNMLVIKHQLKKIFDYRESKLIDLFGKPEMKPKSSLINS